LDVLSLPEQLIIVSDESARRTKVVKVRDALRRPTTPTYVHDADAQTAISRMSV
jgi:hypothetical protein